MPYHTANRVSFRLPRSEVVCRFNIRFEDAGADRSAAAERPHQRRRWKYPLHTQTFELLEHSAARGSATYRLTARRKNYAKLNSDRSSGRDTRPRAWVQYGSRSIAEGLAIPSAAWAAVVAILALILVLMEMDGAYERAFRPGVLQKIRAPGPLREPRQSRPQESARAVPATAVVAFARSAGQIPRKRLS
jgi:hypothetical protein